MDSIPLPLILGALPLFMCIHVFEEFAFPGGFIRWIAAYHTRRLKKTSYYISVNAIGIAAGVLIALAATNTIGYCAFIWFATYMAINGLFHALASLQNKKYCPGTVTGILLFFPLLLASYWKLASDHLLNWQSLTLCGVSAFVVGYFFITVHRQGKNAPVQGEQEKKNLPED